MVKRFKKMLVSRFGESVQMMVLRAAVDVVISYYRGTGTKLAPRSVLYDVTQLAGVYGQNVTEVAPKYLRGVLAHG